MIEVRQTQIFIDWLKNLSRSKGGDPIAVAAVQSRISRFQLGLMGDAKPVGAGVQEARIAYGPGYRLYFTMRGADLIILLCGGEKGSQRRDIELAKSLAATIGG